MLHSRLTDTRFTRPAMRLAQLLLPQCRRQASPAVYPMPLLRPTWRPLLVASACTRVRQLGRKLIHDKAALPRVRTTYQAMGCDLAHSLMP